MLWMVVYVVVCRNGWNLWKYGCYVVAVWLLYGMEENESIFLKYFGYCCNGIYDRNESLKILVEVVSVGELFRS